MLDSYEEDHYEDNGKAWDRLSWGDGGHKPGERFPTYLVGPAKPLQPA